MFAALLLSFAVIFVAELGDKSQLMAMTFALRHRWWVVLGGITVATTAVHLISVAVGHYLGAALPTHLLGILAGVAFVLFGLWTLRGDRLSDDEVTRAQRSTAPAFFAVTSAFLLAELCLFHFLLLALRQTERRKRGRDEEGGEQLAHGDP